MATQVERSDATRKALLEAAQALFEQRGFALTTIDEIAARAGVAKGAFYHHFAAKGEIFALVVDRTQAALARQVVAASAGGRTPVGRILLGMRAYMAECETPGVRRVVLVDGPAVLGWMRWREIDAKYFGEMLRRAVREALGSGASAARVQAISWLLSGAFAEAALVSATEAEPKTTTRHLVRGMETLLAGIRDAAAST